jgi:N-acetylmuramoyl-L-alanine amidase
VAGHDEHAASDALPATASAPWLAWIAAWRPREPVAARPPDRRKRVTGLFGLALAAGLCVAPPAMLGLGGDAGAGAGAGSAWAQTAKPSASPTDLRGTSDGGGWSAKVERGTGKAERPRVTALQMEGDARRTTVQVRISRPVVANMFMLDEPYRAIIDVAELDFRLPPGSGTRGTGLVKSYRYGQFVAGRSRMVIDLTGPATIEGAIFTAAGAGQPGTLKFDLVAVAPAAFQAMRGTGTAADDVSAGPDLRGVKREGASETPNDKPAGAAAGKRLPVVVLDPGHGGVDPGAVGFSGLTEKSVTLAVALQLHNILLQSRRYDVRLTRQTDTFVSLDERVRLSRQHGADLFVSIHADSLAEKEAAQTVKGATIYTLSERASDERASRLADKENAADVVAGLAAVPASAEDQVRSILLDLVQRETANYSVAFRDLLVSSMKGRVPLAKEPKRSAAFKVLRQPDVPAVLIELGYMSNAQDIARLSKPEGQRQLAVTIASAVEGFFKQREATSRR